MFLPAKRIHNRVRTKWNEWWRSHLSGIDDLRKCKIGNDVDGLFSRHVASFRNKLTFTSAAFWKRANPGGIFAVQLVYAGIPQFVSLDALENRHQVTIVRRSFVFLPEEECLVETGVDTTVLMKRPSGCVSSFFARHARILWGLKWMMHEVLCVLYKSV